MTTNLDALTLKQRNLVEKMLRTARMIMEANQQLMPVAVLQGADDKLDIIEMEFSDLEAKRTIYQALQRIGAERKAQFGFYITEAWSAVSQYSTFADSDAAGEAPSEMPNRKEIVMVVVETKESSWIGSADIVKIRGKRTFGQVDFALNPDSAGPMARLLTTESRN